jgi:hypothetical protein
MCSLFTAHRKAENETRLATYRHKRLQDSNLQALPGGIQQHIQVSKKMWRSVEDEQQETVGGGWGLRFCAAEDPWRFHLALQT